MTRFWKKCARSFSHSGDESLCAAVEFNPPTAARTGSVAPPATTTTSTIHKARQARIAFDITPLQAVGFI